MFALAGGPPTRVLAIRARRVPGIELAVALVAFALRLAVVLRSAGLGGSYGYDASVYYSASDALIHGRLPYRDYVLVHPPGIVLALTPFATLGRVLGDHAGFVTATLGWMLLGALNAALVVRVATRFGLGRRAALAGGLAYAMWPGAIGSEFLIRLEPLGNLCLLLGLLGYAAAERNGSRAAALACGAGFGAAVGIKIWWAVPLLLILAWHLPRARRPRLPMVLLGASVALLVIDGPFFLAAPRQMWAMIVVDQLGRARSAGLLTRLVDLTGATHLLAHPGRLASLAVLALAAALLVTGAVLAGRRGPGRLLLALLAAQVLVLLCAPSWYTFYADYLTPELALLVAFATARLAVLAARRRAFSFAAPVAAALAFALALGFVVADRQAVKPFPGTALAASVASSRCVMSDSPLPLIELDVLSRDLANGCLNWVDVAGRRYGLNAQLANGAATAATRRRRWESMLQHYLLAGDSVLVYRARASGIGARLRHVLYHEPIIASADHLYVRRTMPPGVSPAQVRADARESSESPREANSERRRR